MDALPQDYRLVFMLRQIEGLHTQETADSLEINEDTVKTCCTGRVPSSGKSCTHAPA